MFWGVVKKLIRPRLVARPHAVEMALNTGTTGVAIRLLRHQHCEHDRAFRLLERAIRHAVASSARFGDAVVLKRGAESPNSTIYSTFTEQEQAFYGELHLQDLSLPAAVPGQWRKSRESIATRNVNFARRGASVRSALQPSFVSGL